MPAIDMRSISRFRQDVAWVFARGERIMRRILTKGRSFSPFAIPSLSIVAAVALLCAVAASTSAASLAGGLNPTSAGSAKSQDVFYTTSRPSPPSPSTDGKEIYAIEVSGLKITTRKVGPTFVGGCASLALSPSGTLYSVCGPLFGAQQLATIDQQTGRANLFGMTTPGLAVMALTFAPNGILYAVGDCNPNLAQNFECNPDLDPNYNSLYTVDVKTGAFTRVGRTDAPQFFMDLAFDRNGQLFGVTTTLNPSTTPAILYSIDLAKGHATKIVNLVGSNYVMGLAFGRNNKLYASDFEQKPGLYLVDPKTGFETAIAALPFGFSSGLELINP
jgi:hypothetical protein